MDNRDRVDDEAINILFVLKTDTPTPTSDINTAALNDKRSLIIGEFIKSYFYIKQNFIKAKSTSQILTANNLDPVLVAVPNIILYSI